MAANDTLMNDDKKSKRWTILVIGDHKQLGTYEIRKSTFTAAVTAVIGIILVAAGFIWFLSTSDLRLQNDLQERLAASVESVDAVKQENADLSKRIKEMEEALAATFKEATGDKGESPVTSPDHFNKMAVENFEINLDKPSNSLHFKFLLRNTASYNNPISGHIFVILKPEYLDVSTWSCYPKTDLAEGKPHNSASGESFTIARFKTIRGSFTTVPQRMQQFFISVWVFSDDGKLIMTKDFFIRKEL
jgi:cell division protein FtsL